jgi:hypothetical protein
MAVRVLAKCLYPCVAIGCESVCGDFVRMGTSERVAKSKENELLAIIGMCEETSQIFSCSQMKWIFLQLAERG